ncbi:MAG: FtsX-like permease family protein [Candidatus Izemoplasmataceae bacterium]
MRTLFKHVSRVFLSHKVLMTMLGLVLLFSSFIYTFISMGIGSVEHASEAFFNQHNQETVAIGFSERLVDSDFDALPDECPKDGSLTLFVLGRIAPDCFDAVVEDRMDRIESLVPEVELEARYYKDMKLSNGHNVRLMTMNQDVNTTLIEEGARPRDNEIGISRTYGEANGIEIGDTIDVGGDPYEVTAFVLFPDYTLPVFEDPIMFNSRMQTPALVNEATFDALEAFTGVHVGGSGDDAEETVDTIEDADLEFVGSVLRTENVPRSGAVYSEIQGSQMMALLVAIFTAATGIGVAGAFVSRMIERSKKPLGVLLALGMRKRTIILAHLLFLSLASLGFVLAGFALGYWLSPGIRDLFLSSYLLPKARVSFSLGMFFIAVGVPMMVLNIMAGFMLYRLFRETPDALMRDRLKVKGMFVRPKSKKFLRLPFTLRLQIAFLSRHAGKTLLYLFSLMIVFYMAFVTTGMLNSFGKTLPAYYESTRIESVGRCDPLQSCPVPGDASKVLEVSEKIKDTPSLLVGLEAGDAIHPLRDSEGDSLKPELEQGAVITKSHQLLSGLKRGDTFTLEHGDATLTLSVTGVADIYAGSRVFIERDALAQLYTEDFSSYNTIYSSVVLDEADYLSVHEVDSMLEQIEEMDGLLQSFINITIGMALVIGGLVIYLITRLSADDHAYTIAMLKVIGYKNKAITTYLLGGYLGLSILAFVLAVPLSVLTQGFVTDWFAHAFNMVIPLAIPWRYVFIIMVIYGIIYAIAIQSARTMVRKLPLSEALKRTQW